jgi:hypothetical protein
MTLRPEPLEGCAPTSSVRILGSQSAGTQANAVNGAFRSTAVKRARRAGLRGVVSHQKREDARLGPTLPVGTAQSADPAEHRQAISTAGSGPTNPKTLRREFAGRKRGTPRYVPELSAPAAMVVFVLRTRRSPMGDRSMIGQWSVNGARPSKAVGRDRWGPDLWGQDPLELA